MASAGEQVRIAVMGATGSGKTTFINRASGSNLPVGKGLESCTMDVQTSKPFVLDGRMVTLIDTPGFDDTSRNDTDVLSAIAAYLSNTYEQGAKLAGVVYMHRISDVRMGGTSKRNFRIFRELCGENTLRNVLVVTNMWGSVDPRTAEAREHELSTNDRLLKPVLDKGAQLLRHDDDTQASAHAVLRRLAHRRAATLAIQHEIVNERKELAQTLAGAELTRALMEQAERHDDEITRLRGEMEAAVHAKEDTRKELQAEVDRRREEVERIQRDVERMAADFHAEKKRLEGRIAEMEAENRRHLDNLQELQEQVNDARKQVECMHAQHKRLEQHKEDDQSKKLVEDITFLINIVTKTILPTSIETRLRGMVAQIAHTLRESTTSEDGFLNTYFSR